MRGRKKWLAARYSLPACQDSQDSDRQQEEGRGEREGSVMIFLPSVVSSTARHFSVMGDDLVMFTKTNATYVVCGLTRSILWTDMGFGHNTAILTSSLTPYLQQQRRGYSADHLICQLISKPLWGLICLRGNLLFLITNTLSGPHCTVLVLRMAHRKLKEIKQEASMLPGPAVPGCCLVSFHFLWAILSTSTVPSLSFGLELLTKLRLRHYDQSPRLFMNLCSTQCSLIVGVSLPLSIRLFVFAPNQRVMAVPMTALLAHSLLEEMEQLRWRNQWGRVGPWFQCNGF